MTDHTDKLKPCPFCGCEDVEHYHDGEYSWVQCLKCYGSSQQFDGSTDGRQKDRDRAAEFAITAWNTRPALSAPSPDPLGEGEEYGVTGNWWGSEGSQADIDVDGLVEEKSIDEIALGCSIMATAIEGKGHPNAALYLRTAAAALTTQRDAIRREAFEEAAAYLDGYAGGHHMAQSCAKAVRALIP